MPISFYDHPKIVENKVPVWGIKLTSTDPWNEVWSVKWTWLSPLCREWISALSWGKRDIP